MSLLRFSVKNKGHPDVGCPLLLFCVHILMFLIGVKIVNDVLSCAAGGAVLLCQNYGTFVRSVVVRTAEHIHRTL